MTRKQLDHERYERKRDEYLARSRAYYQAHKEIYKQKTKEYVQRQRALAFSQTTAERPITTKELEAQQPDIIRMNLSRLREEYLKIHITERPPYELFLKQKQFEYEEKLKQ